MDEVVDGAALADPELEFELLLLMLIEIDGTKQNASTRLLPASATQREFWAALKNIPLG